MFEKFLPFQINFIDIRILRYELLDMKLHFSIRILFFKLTINKYKEFKKIKKIIKNYKNEKISDGIYIFSFDFFSSPGSVRTTTATAIM
jgi:hypothetical protein